MEKNDEGKSKQLLKAWRWIGDRPTLFFFDEGSTHSIISIDLAKSLGITLHAEGSIGASVAFKDIPPNIIELMGSLMKIQLQTYTDHLDFQVGDIADGDVILG